MDWKQIEASWHRYVVPAKARWMKLSEEQIKATGGRYDVLSSRVQESYGLTKQQSDFQIDEWQSRQGAR